MKLWKDLVHILCCIAILPLVLILAIMETLRDAHWLERPGRPGKQ